MCRVLFSFDNDQVSEDEIANAAGISDMHDGVNFMRAACVIAVEKVSFEDGMQNTALASIHGFRMEFTVEVCITPKNEIPTGEAAVVITLKVYCR